MIRISLFLVIICISTVSSLVGNNYSMKSINTLNGLPQNDVYSIVQDDDNFLWLATNDGLCKYDGSNFHRFQKGDFGLTSNLVISLRYDSNNSRIFVGTADMGLFVYDMRRRSFSHIEIDGCSDIKYIEIDAVNTVWVCDDSFNLFQVEDNGDGTFSSKIFDLKVQELTSDGEGHIIVKYDRWLYHILLTNKRKLYDVAEIKNSGYILRLRLFSGVWYALSNYQLHSFDEESSQLNKIHDIKARDFCITKSGNIIASNEDGIMLIHPDGDGGYGEPQVVQEGNIWVNTFFEDRSGVVWIGTSRNGLIKLNLAGLPFATNRYESNVEVIYEDDEQNVWVTTSDGELHILHNGEYENPLNRTTSDPTRNVISAIAKHPKTQKTYISNMEGGISSAITSAGRKLKFKRERALGEDVKDVEQMISDSNYLWIATYYDGVILYDVETEQIVNRITNQSTNGMLQTNTIRSILKDRYNNIWCGTEYGVVMISSTSRFASSPTLLKLEEMEPCFGGLDIYAMSIIEATDGTLYIGTIGDGVLKFCYNNRNVTPKIYNSKLGLSNNSIHAIVEDDNRMIWVSTNLGINRINPETDEITNYDINDGLQDNEFCDFSVCKRANGEIIFGGRYGLNRFFPDKITYDTIAPKVSLTDMVLFNNVLEVGKEFDGRVILRQSIEYCDAVHLKHNQNSFSFNFAAMNYSSAGRYKYLYMLKGFDNNWIDATNLNATAKYTNIPAGEYDFIVKCCNGYDVWSESKVLHITIEPALWMRWYAYLAYVMLIVAFASVWVYYYKRLVKHRAQTSLAKREKEQIRRYTLKRAELFTNISHELRTPLTLIISPLQNLIRNYTFEPKVVEILSKAEYNSEKMLNIVNELMEFTKSDNNSIDLNLEESDIVDMCRQSVAIFREWASQMNIEIELFSSAESLITLLDRKHMESILYNLISNAIKHTPSNGSVSIEVDQSNGMIDIRVSDNGSGISESAAPFIFNRFFNDDKRSNSTGVGLALTKTLVEMHDGAVDFISTAGEGTTFIISIPCRDHNQIDVSNIDVDEQSDAMDHRPSDGDDTLCAVGELQPIRTVSYGEMLTVLIIDDNHDIVELISDLLTPEFRVIKAYDGESGYEACVANIPDMVITDVMMPKIDGVELCRMVKQTPATSHIPVVMLTAKSDKTTHKLGFQANADAFCSKPFDNSILVATIHSIIANRRAIIDRIGSSTKSSPDELAQNEQEQNFLRDMIAIVEQHMGENDFSVEFVCKEMGISHIKLNKKIRSITGLTSVAFIKRIKLKRAAEMLATQRYTVSEVTYACGFNDLKYFRQIFAAEIGALPSSYIK